MKLSKCYYAYLAVLQLWCVMKEAEFLDCANNYTLENGSVDFSGQESIDIDCHKDCAGGNGSEDRGQETTYRYSRSINVTCNKGYKLQGSGVIICLENGSWSDDNYCKAKDTSSTSSGNQPESSTHNDGSGDTSSTSSGNQPESSTHNDGSGDPKTYYEWIAVGVVLFVATLICVVVLLLFKYAGKVRLTEDGDGPDLKALDLEVKTWGKFRATPIPLTEFSAYVKDFSSGTVSNFEDAFRHITDHSPSHSTAVAETPACRLKTFYSNIIPFDHSRVLLKSREGEEGSDFINANYIPGYSSRREYIATQGPDGENANDFWRMIWEQDVNIIVMLTKHTKSYKGSLPRNRSSDPLWSCRNCRPYWPDEVQGPVLYGDIIVQTYSETVMTDHIIRNIEMQLGKIKKHATQLHFVGWPEEGMPKRTWPFLNFVTIVRQFQIFYTKSSKHIVVHCSNGVGRTGMFIAVDRLLQQVRNKEDLDVCSVILDMRNYRCNMVKTEEQLKYIFECVRHFITMEDDEENEEEAESQYIGLGSSRKSFDNDAFTQEDM